MPVSFPANSRCGWFPAADPGLVTARRRERRREVSVFPQSPSLSLPRQRSMTSKPSSLTPSQCHEEHRLTGSMSTRSVGQTRLLEDVLKKSSCPTGEVVWLRQSFFHFHFHAVSSSLPSFKIHTEWEPMTCRFSFIFRLPQSLETAAQNTGTRRTGALR